jgi:hypothetical protein
MFTPRHSSVSTSTRDCAVAKHLQAGPWHFSNKFLQEAPHHHVGLGALIVDFYPSFDGQETLHADIW